MNERTIELYMPDGKPEHLIIGKISNWDGFPFKVARTSIDLLKNQKTYANKCNWPGIYFLFSKNENNEHSVYIGESESTLDRIIQHLKDDWEDFFWYSVVAFTSEWLGRAEIRYLEDKFYNLALEVDRYNIRFTQTFSNVKITEPKRGSLEPFCVNVMQMLNVLGFKLFEKPQDIASSDKNKVFYLTTNKNKYNAKGTVSPDGFVVFKDSIIKNTVVDSVSDNVKELRKKYNESGTVIECVLQKDVLFSSPSAAAKFVTGLNVSGHKSWKLSDGTTYGDFLKQID